MAFSLSLFSGDFFGDRYSAAKSDLPTTLADALASMSDEVWDEMAREVFAVSGDELSLDTVWEKVIETDTCSSLKSPVEVWIDPEGFYTVLVYDNYK